MVRGPAQQSAVPLAGTIPFLNGLPQAPAPVSAPDADGVAEEEEIDYVPLDPQHPLTLSNVLIRIPQPGYALEKLLNARREEFIPMDYDEDDLRIFSGDVGDGTGATSASIDGADHTAVDDWKHNREWVDKSIEQLMPPPAESSPMASTSLQKELRAMLKEQNSSRSFRELGWYMPEELIGDNLYQWIVELHSFEGTLPVAQDMEKQ